MLERLRLFIQTNQLFSNEDHLFLAVSGGLDSMVMLHLFLRLGDSLVQRPAVIHINHKQRGVESDADESFVRAICLENGVDFHLKQLVDLAPDASEDNMRQARYSAYEEITSPYPNSRIATAHHLDDQIETFLMRLASGSSLRGLGGIPLKRGPYFRPLLLFRRSELQDYAEKEHVAFRTDASNQDIGKLRNHIRVKILPTIREVFGSDFYRGFEKTIAELKTRQAQITVESRRVFGSLFKVHGYNGELELRAYRALPYLERRDLFHFCVSELDPLNYIAQNGLWKGFEQFVSRAQTGTSFFITEKITVFKNRNQLLFSTTSAVEIPDQDLFLDSTVNWGDCQIHLQKVSRTQVKLEPDPNREFFCGDGVTFPLLVRAWREGDRFTPLGMKGRKKISDFFVDQKIGRQQKKQIPVILSDQEILWVAGFRLAEPFKYTKKCKSIFKISMHKEEHK